MDDLYDGWTGLAHVDAQLATLLVPLAEGRPGHYRRYDWHAGALAETVTVAPDDLTTGLLVVEGVGSGSATHTDLATVLVWVEAPRGVRLRRGIERDGGHLREQWLAWQDAEDAHHARHRTRERADVLVDGTRPAG
ncbi:uridine kinase family protein [Nocardioides dongxiaopingii]|uniref:uridine kinase family protein n=1 Tax=Nocardioides sp. S-1144 TaxID=2582905 RepID=UPI0021CB8176|nr:4-amino-4-deoxy-L-arabinose transferase [Nocardioides sp. S-1144]